MLIALERKRVDPQEKTPKSVNILTKLYKSYYTPVNEHSNGTLGHLNMEPGERFWLFPPFLGPKAADPNAPPPRSNHTTSLHENSVVLFGGHGGVDKQCLSDERKVMKGKIH